MRLLIIGNLNGHIITASKIAISRGALVTLTSSIDEAMQNLRVGKGADLVFIDVEFDVQALIQGLNQERFSIPVVACGVGVEKELAVAAIKAGAKEYLPLPPDAELIAAVIETVAKSESSVISRDPAMKSVLKLAEQISPSDASVLITGESGVGKEVMARFIHQKSRRKNAPFISVNCAAIPENLMESELFGHEKGSFTGALARRIGKFEEANGGTLLLDEISEMHPSLQAKLLRAIQEREIDRVGGARPVKVNIRILATSNRDLENEVKIGNFREDLFFRLNVVNLKLPALRERVLDIIPLAEYFIEKYVQSNAMQEKKLSKDAADLLLRHFWKGNVRELENTIHRAVLLSYGDEIVPENLHLPHFKDEKDPYAQTLSQEKGGDHLHGLLVGRTVADVEKDLILGTLSHCLGNRTQAAHILGISIRTLRNKLRLYSDITITSSKVGAYQKAIG